MDIQAWSSANVIVLTPQGRIDHQTADDFSAALSPYLAKCAGESCKLVLDLAGVDYMSSVGLRALMVAAKQARAQGGTLVISGLGETLREIFQISRFDRVFTVYDDARDAVAGIAPEAVAAFDRDAAAPAC